MCLDFDGGRFTVTQKAFRVGKQVRLRLASLDVSLTVDLQSNTSIRNIFNATADNIINVGDAQVIVRLIVCGVPIVSRNTRKSAVELDLKTGNTVYAKVKRVVLLT